MSEKNLVKLEDLPPWKPGTTIEIPLGLLPEYLKREGLISTGYNPQTGALEVRKENGKCLTMISSGI